MLLSSGLFNLSGALLIVAVVVVAICSPLIRMAYRKRVVRLMGLNQVQPRPAGWWDARVRPGPAPSAGAHDAASLLAAADAWGRRITLATAAGWLAFTLTAWAIAQWALNISPWMAQLEFAVPAGFFAMVPLFANLAPTEKRRALIISVTFSLLLVGVLELVSVAGSTGEDDDPLDSGDLVAVLMLIGFVAILFQRRLRGLILPSSLVLTVAVLAFVLPLAFIEGNVGSCLSGTAWDGAAPDSASTQFWTGSFATLGAVLAMFALWMGFQSVGLLSRMVEHGWISDLSMVSLIGLALMAIGIIFGTVGETADSYSTWITLLPLPWVALSVGVYLLVLGRRDNAPARPLLLLRVFSRDKKQQALLEQVQARWRYLGPVNLAGGPDLVDANIDPYECSMFLSSRLHDLYLPQALSREHLASRFDAQPDREGRYRVNEMFNFNTAWRENVEQLILMSPTILLDLRGLTAEREGTSFEVGLLAKHALLGRVVAFGDEQTDWDHVDAQLQKEGQSLQSLKRVEVSDDTDELFTELLNLPATV
jgi:hypothetical protein